MTFQERIQEFSILVVFVISCFALLYSIEEYMLYRTKQEKSLKNNILMVEKIIRHILSIELSFMLLTFLGENNFKPVDNRFYPIIAFTLMVSMFYIPIAYFIEFWKKKEKDMAWLSGIGLIGVLYVWLFAIGSTYVEYVNTVILILFATLSIMLMLMTFKVINEIGKAKMFRLPLVIIAYLFLIGATSYLFSAAHAFELSISNEQAIYVSFRAMYSLPEMNQYDLYNNIYMLQFVTAKIIDTTTLGYMISILTDKKETDKITIEDNKVKEELKI